VLLPYRVGETLPSGDGVLPTTAVDLGHAGVVAWSVQNDADQDVFVMRESTAPESFTLPGGEVLESDGACFAVRTAGPELFAVVVRGSYLTLDGSSLITGGDPEGVTIIE